MWQAFVYPGTSLGLPTMSRPQIGKLRHSRKEARIEARRMAQAFADRWIHQSWGYVAPDVPRVHVLVPILGPEGTYSYKMNEPLATVGVRWQPDEE